MRGACSFTAGRALAKRGSFPSISQLSTNVWIWSFGRGKTRMQDGTKRQKAIKSTDWAGVCIFAVCITAVTFVLVYFKYWDFFKDMFSFGHSGSKVSVTAPIGISFITFSAVSYLADIRRGDADCKSLIDCALYLCFSRRSSRVPIVLWKDFLSSVRRKEADAR